MSMVSSGDGKNREREKQRWTTLSDVNTEREKRKRGRNFPRLPSSEKGRKHADRMKDFPRMMQFAYLASWKESWRHCIGLMQKFSTISFLIFENFIETKDHQSTTYAPLLSTTYSHLFGQSIIPSSKSFLDKDWSKVSRSDFTWSWSSKCFSRRWLRSERNRC